MKLSSTAQDIEIFDHGDHILKFVGQKIEKIFLFCYAEI